MTLRKFATALPFTVALAGTGIEVRLLEWYPS